MQLKCTRWWRWWWRIYLLIKNSYELFKNKTLAVQAALQAISISEVLWWICCFKAMHWKASEVKMEEDQKTGLSIWMMMKRIFLTQIFRFFVQADTEVCGYYNQLSMVLQVPEIAMMTGSFQNREAVHMEAYSLLINSLNLPESEFKAFWSTRLSVTNSILCIILH